jgi:hypothetical protein
MLLLRPDNGQFQASLGCKVAGSDKVLTIRLREDEPGHFMRVLPRPSEVDLNVVEEGKWSLREVFVSPSVRAFESPNSRPVYLWPHSLLRVADKQILGSGFNRISSSLDVSASEDMLGLLYDSGTKSMFDALAGTIDCSSTLIASGAFTVPTYNSTVPMVALVYLNKTRKTLFALVVRRHWNVGLEAAFIEPSSPMIDMRSVSAGTMSKTLESGWHVSIYPSVPDDVDLNLHLTIKPPTSLETAMRKRSK